MVFFVQIEGRVCTDRITGIQNAIRYIEENIMGEPDYAVFPVKGAMPNALQEVNTKIRSEWLPNCREYEMDGNINIEMYAKGDTNSENYYSEIRIPVKKRL